MSSFSVDETNRKRRLKALEKDPSKPLKKTWRVIEVYYENNVRFSRTVPKEAFIALGIDPTWEIEQARKRVKELNQTNWIKKKEITAAARRVRGDKIVESAFIPKDLAEEFLDILRIEASSGNEQKLVYQWNFAQDLIAELKIDPKEYYEERRRIYKYFQKAAISNSYVEKVLRVLNLWGKFVCRKQRTFFEPVENPTGVDLQRIKSAYLNSPNYQGPSAPLTPELLKDIRPKLPNEKQGNWCFVTVWLGTRPEETDGFIDDPSSYRITFRADLNVEVLEVYQTKLVAIDIAKRWKPIPIIYPEQKEALRLIRENLLESPLNKTLTKLTDGKVTRYGGRKGFTDLLLGLGEDLEQISVWLGHQDINRTWKDYKNKQKVTFKGPKKAV